jgi:hypothetical protein
MRTEVKALQGGHHRQRHPAAFDGAFVEDLNLGHSGLKQPRVRLVIVAEVLYPALYPSLQKMGPDEGW